jgi:hypothetical protein
MRASPSTFLSVAVVLMAARSAYAQSCCAGSVATTPGRLAMYEDALIGVQAKISRSYGQHDVSTHYAKDPTGASELELEQDLIGTVRLASRLETGVLVPYVETIRHASGIEDTGHGLGDVALVGRYDLLRTREIGAWPGVALVAGVTFPTGRPVDRSTHVLAADATGTGAFQATLGAIVEESFGPENAYFAVLSAYVSERTPRTVSGVKSRLGTQGSFSLALGRSFTDDSAIAIFVSRTIEGKTKVGDEEAEGRSATGIGLVALHPFTDHWRAQASAALNPPLDGFGKNQLALATFTLMLARGWS